MEGFGLSSGLRVEVLIAFAVAVGFFIVVGLSTGLYNHIQRRRGRPGLFAYTPPVRPFRANGRNQNRPKGLQETEIEAFCPEIEFRGPEEEPRLIISEGENTNGNKRTRQDVVIPVPPEVAGNTYTWNNTRETGAPYSGSSWETVKDSIPTFSKTVDDEVTDAEDSTALPDVMKFFLGKHIMPEGVCAVCLETVEVGDVLRLLDCGHAFHTSCITHWLASANRCPLCNVPPMKQIITNLPSNDILVNRTVTTTTQISPNSQQAEVVDREIPPSMLTRESKIQRFEEIKLSLARRYLQRLRRDNEYVSNENVHSEC
eukprot:jgi/Galph1/2670/GphlegSOOS_G1373.1